MLYHAEKDTIRKATSQLLALMIRDMQAQKMPTERMGEVLAHQILVLLPDIASHMIETMTGQAPTENELDRIFAAAVRLHRLNAKVEEVH